MKYSLFILLSYVVVSRPWQQMKYQAYKQEYNSDEIYNRLITVMQTVHKEGMYRHESLDVVRFFYEKTPYYELGYIMGEIIERYRKMVNHVRQRHTWKSTPVHYLVRKVQLIQHLYFEIFHLTGMMNEIDHKYQVDLRYSNIYGNLTASDLAKIHAQIKKDKIAAEKAKRKAWKKAMKEKKKKAVQDGKWPKYTKPVRNKTHWEIEYGWDIGPDW